jgi:hypothetical protein
MTLAKIGPMTLANFWVTHPAGGPMTWRKAGPMRVATTVRRTSGLGAGLVR